MRHLSFFTGLLVIVACTKVEPPPPEQPLMSVVCFAVEPRDALVKVQGAKLRADGCVETFPGEVSVEATAPGYQRYQALMLIEGHAATRRIALIKDAPMSTPTSSPTKPAGE